MENTDLAEIHEGALPLRSQEKAVCELWLDVEESVIRRPGAEIRKVEYRRLLRFASRGLAERAARKIVAETNTRVLLHDLESHVVTEPMEMTR